MCTFGSYGGVYLFSTVVVVAVEAVPPADVRDVFTLLRDARIHKGKGSFPSLFPLCVPLSLSQVSVKHKRGWRSEA